MAFLSDVLREASILRVSQFSDFLAFGVQGFTSEIRKSLPTFIFFAKAADDEWSYQITQMVS